MLQVDDVVDTGYTRARQLETSATMPERLLRAAVLCIVEISTCGPRACADFFNRCGKACGNAHDVEPGVEADRVLVHNAGRGCVAEQAQYAGVA